MKVFIDVMTGTWGLATDLRIVDLVAIEDEYSDQYSYLAYLQDAPDWQIIEFGRQYGNRIGHGE
jgi:hypothetical protein